MVADVARRYLPGVLAADAAWDVAVGAALAAAPWLAGRVGLPAPGLWPVFVLVGIGCFVFAGLLVRGAKGAGTVEIARAAAIANAAAVVVAVALALAVEPGPGWLSLLGIAALGCAVFAVLEGIGARTPGAGSG
jgi:hypothetical protein